MTTLSSLVPSFAANLQGSNSLPLLAHDKDSSSSLPPLATPAASTSSSKQVTSRASSKTAAPSVKSHEGEKENERPSSKEGKDQNEGVGGASVTSTSPDAARPSSSQTAAPPLPSTTPAPGDATPAGIDDNEGLAVILERECRVVEKEEEAGLTDLELATHLAATADALKDVLKKTQKLSDKRQLARVTFQLLSEILKFESLIEFRLTLTDRSRLIKNRFSIDRCKIAGEDCEPADGDLRLVCGKCWEVAYCSRRHQRLDWKKHKIVCHHSKSHTLWLSAKKKSLDNANKSASIDDVD